MLDSVLFLFSIFIFFYLFLFYLGLGFKVMSQTVTLYVTHVTCHYHCYIVIIEEDKKF